MYLSSLPWAPGSPHWALAFGVGVQGGRARRRITLLCTYVETLSGHFFLRGGQGRLTWPGPSLRLWAELSAISLTLGSAGALL